MTPTSPKPPVWRSMRSSPLDGTIILLGLWVKNTRTNRFSWEYYLGYFSDDENEGFTAEGETLPWLWDDFDCWTHVPKPPKRNRIYD